MKGEGLPVAGGIPLRQDSQCHSCQKHQGLMQQPSAHTVLHTNACEGVQMCIQWECVCVCVCVCVGETG